MQRGFLFVFSSAFIATSFFQHNEFIMLGVKQGICGGQPLPHPWICTTPLHRLLFTCGDSIFGMQCLELHGCCCRHCPCLETADKKVMGLEYVIYCLKRLDYSHLRTFFQVTVAIVLLLCMEQYPFLQDHVQVSLFRGTAANRLWMYIGCTLSVG